MPRTVREWTLHDEIGRGGMGVVYRATHEILGGDWAVKVIRPELGEDTEVRQRFLSEVMLLKRLHHPNVVEVETPFLEGGQLYLPMEYLSGQSLDALLKGGSGSWDVTDAVFVLRQAAEGIGFAHSQNPAILHRDVKPGNIQILEGSRVKVLDFGLAQTLGDKSITATGKAVGTPAYMAPEVLDGKKATPRSDVYSLGLILYRLLAGRLPYDMPEDDSSIQATFVAVIRGLERGLPDVREFAALTPAALADLTMSTLSRDPAGRPANGADLARLLGRVATRPVLPKPHHKAEYCADSTCLGIDLNSATVIKSVTVDGLGTERKSPMPEIKKSVPNQEDADRSLIGLDLRSVSDKPPEQPVRSASVPTKTERKADSVPVRVGATRKIDPVKVADKPVEVRTVEPNHHRSSRKRHVVPVTIVLSGLAVVAAMAGYWFFYEEPRRVFEQARFDEIPEVEDVGPISAQNVTVPGKAAVISSSLVEWVQIPGGSFQMGSSAGDAESDEKPVHEVSVQSFEMAKTEVTVAQYRKCAEDGACSKPYTGTSCNWEVSGRDNYPINCVNWEQASAYAKWVGGRLPTEAEWEYAARSGGKDRTYPWGNQPATCQNTVMSEGEFGCGKNSTWPVCSKTAGNTDNGLCDMAGNVMEWVQDWYHPSYNRALSIGTASESAFGSRRVFRGGSWVGRASSARASCRAYYVPGINYASLGLRPARSI